MPPKNFKTISIDKDTYATVKALAEESSPPKKVAELTRDLINTYKDLPLFRVLVNLGVKPEEVEWGAKWQKDSHFLDAILSDPEIKSYKSTAWIRTGEYPEKAGHPQFGNTLGRRLADAHNAEDFSFEKILIVSAEAEKDKETWRWIWKWWNMKVEYRDKVEVVVVREDMAEKEFKISYKEKKRVFYDMGIYGTKLVALLSIGEHSDPGMYRWITPSLVPAEEAFAGLKDCGMQQEEVKKYLLEQI